jgi:1-deoxy-D-xylulose-5-phosphate reductoisomerase
MGKNAGAIYNGANEAAVELFLSGKISFPEIAARVAAALESVPAFSADCTEAVYESDRLARINVASK